MSMIDKWRTTYSEYLTHNGVDSSKHDAIWVDTTNNLISLWQKMESGEIQQIYKSFNHFLQVQMEYYEKINENYRRDSHKKPVEVIKSNGGRYWL